MASWRVGLPLLVALLAAVCVPGALAMRRRNDPPNACLPSDCTAWVLVRGHFTGEERPQAPGLLRVENPGAVTAAHCVALQLEAGRLVGWHLASDPVTPRFEESLPETCE